MLVADLVTGRLRLKETRSRLKKRQILAELVSRLDAEEIRIGISYLSGQPVQSKLGVGYAAVAKASAPPSPVPGLTLVDVHKTFERLTSVAGRGSQERRNEILQNLLGRATEPEQEFLKALMLRGLRQGSLEGLLTEAVADAFSLETASLLRAVMVSGDLADVAAAAARGGARALDGFRMQMFRPLKPMLAQTAESAAAGVASFALASVEEKIDGARIQVHRLGDRVAVYTRNLNDVTARMSDVVAATLTYVADQFILDGEVIALDDAGRPRSFQSTMGRFGRASEETIRASARRLTPMFFDCLHLNGTDLIDESTRTRLEALDGLVPVANRVRRIATSNDDEARGFLEATLGAGHEGVMIKDMDAPYSAGRRGADWLKLKPAHTLDLVVLAVEWGSGRRSGWLSNIHLGAHDGDDFVMLGKTFKGMTDEMLAWQTERFLDLETHREGHVVHVRPEQVVEVAVDGVQASSRYPGGMALRFARVKRYRDDKTAFEADTLETVRAIHTGGSAGSAP